VTPNGMSERVHVCSTAGYLSILVRLMNLEKLSRQIRVDGHIPVADKRDVDSEDVKAEVDTDELALAVSRNQGKRNLIRTRSSRTGRRAEHRL